ncbi:MAG: 16S rRNA (adenine(1518)-N(6)/adenine(1519)-N(6))-dimethyltransferase RsmA [Oscillospiraceae bacterium]|nr:16S rRNA (adenine(1518)-N(6)/adenine(1519)-N(6))-dimethyltransferase RsmA [Oscillospiraceae bacterium]
MNLCDLNTIKALLARHGFHFSKSMGQNFLIDESVPYDIAESSGACEENGVLEIGPGIGPLTTQLCRRAGKVVSVELDDTLLPILAETMAEFDNFTLVSGDILKTDIAALVDEHFAGLQPMVCANLPYNITTPVLTALLEVKRFSRLTVLIQKEVAQRISARPGTADYGYFTVFMQYYTEPALLFDVPNTCFIPQPKVTSSVLRCDVRTTPAVELHCPEAFFFRTVKAAFALRRKTLVNSLQTGFSAMDKARLTEIVVQCGFEPSVRGEKLSLEEFARLADALYAAQ